MSSFAAFRRQPVPQQLAQNLRTITIPAPTRGIIQSENEAFMTPGGANVQINWAPTMKGVKLRAGHIRWADLHALDAVVPPVPSASRLPVISMFDYQAGSIRKMYAANATKLFDVTTTTPSMIKSGMGSGNCFAPQMANQSGSYMLVGNDAGDLMLRTADGNTFFQLSGVIGNAGDGIPNITYDPTKLPAGVAQGTGLAYAWKYRNRLFFVQKNSMNAWYLPIDAVGGVLQPIYLSGSATRGGKLLFGAAWSIDAGDGIDDKCVFVTDLGELLIFTGSNPGDSANWRQEGRYQIAAPLGMHAHMAIGGDLLVMTVDGIVPVSQAITKDSGNLELAMITKTIKPLWRDEVTLGVKRAWPSWSMKRWDEYGGVFVATPGGATPSTKHCLVANNATGAWCIYTWDITCMARIGADMFFGTQDGLVMQADRTGYDDGKPYVCTLVGGWELFQSGAAQTTWRQARAVFTSGAKEPFRPQLAACTDYVIKIPPPPAPGPDPGLLDVWDQGKWNVAKWDQPAAGKPAMLNTMWVSIGRSGFAHAPICQVTVAQQAPPSVELIAIATVQETGGVNV